MRDVWTWPKADKVESQLNSSKVRPAVQDETILQESGSGKHNESHTDIHFSTHTHIYIYIWIYITYIYIYICGGSPPLTGLVGSTVISCCASLPGFWELVTRIPPSRMATVNFGRLLVQLSQSSGVRAFTGGFLLGGSHGYVAVWETEDAEGESVRSVDEEYHLSTSAKVHDWVLAWWRKRLSSDWKAKENLVMPQREGKPRLWKVWC